MTPGEVRSEEHTSELQSRPHLVCRLLLEKKNVRLDATVVGRTATGGVAHGFLSPGKTPHAKAIVLAGANGDDVLGYGFFFFNDTATTEIYTLSLHDALPI